MVSAVFLRNDHPAVLGILAICQSVYNYGTITLYGSAFQRDSSSPTRHDTSPHATSPSSYPGRIRFDLFRFRSPLLTESRLFSFPPLIRMLCFSGFLYPSGTMCYKTQHDVTFGDLRINVYLRLPGAYRSLSRPSSVIKPRHPLYSVSVLDLNQEQALTEPEPYSLSNPHTCAIERGGLHASVALRVYTPAFTYLV